MYLFSECQPSVEPLPSQVDTRIRAADAGTAELKGNRGPPSALVRVASAFLYIVPWIDVLSLGREVYHFFPTSLLLYLIPGTCHMPAEVLQLARHTAACNYSLELSL